MAYEFTLADVAFLAAAEGRAALAAAEALALTNATLLTDLTVLRRTVGLRAGAVAETVRLRRRARERWAVGDRSAGHRSATDRNGGGHDGVPWRAGDGWLFTDTALQQASPPVVAAHRARRLAAFVREVGAAGVHDVTCSIGTDLAALGDAGVLMVGSDLDAVRLAMAGQNLRRAGLAPRLFRGDARAAGTRGLVRYADPARRDGTGRRISSADTVPPLADLDAADPAQPPVLRLPPGIDYERLDRPGEIEIVSWRGSVREAVSWPPAMATAMRRASVLGDDGVREVLVDSDPAEDAVMGAGKYLVEPDPAIIRAHLVQQYAARYRLARLDPLLAYLTGESVPPGVRGFEIIDAATFSEKTVRAWMRRDGVGTLEIKQRGTPIVPDRLRASLRPRGDSRITRTLVVARIGRARRAFWCQAIP